METRKGKTMSENPQGHPTPKKRVSPLTKPIDQSRAREKECRVHDDRKVDQKIRYVKARLLMKFFSKVLYC